MNWTLLIRNVCEAYPGLSPKDVETWSLDQVFMLAIDRNKLESITGATVQVTAGQLTAMGIEQETTETLLSVLKREKAAKQVKGKSRRQKRREARERADAYKKMMGIE